jgi:hypothetical protein
LPRLKLIPTKAGERKPIFEMGFFVLNSNFLW